MTYVNLAIVPVPTENRKAYLALEEIMAKLFVKYGALHSGGPEGRMRERIASV